jgi:hypothetical protein
MRRPTSAAPLAESSTATSRLLLAEIDDIDLTLAAGCRQNGHHPPHGDAEPVRRQRLLAELLGDDGADPVDQIGQIVAEIELGRMFHGGVLAAN